jgi:hypothetical protein
MIKWFSHIDITQKCHIGDCVYCSRYTRHLKDKKDMSLDAIEQALIAYKNFPNKIGCIGGEPQLHSQFKQVCELYRKYFPKEKLGLWTSINPETSKYKDDIKQTFGFIAFNEHNDEQLKVCQHQPFTVASVDIVRDVELRKALQEDCWFRKNWCGSVNHLGAYHCEIAMGIAQLTGFEGWEVKSNWWNNDWHKQQHLCDLCGACVPMDRQVIGNKKQKISETFFNLLNFMELPIGEHEKIENYIPVKQLKESAKTWRPGQYRGDINSGEPIGSNLDWSKYED